jgi:hypothetical protein
MKYEPETLIERESTKTIALRNEQFRGEVVTLNGQPVHLSLVKVS